MARPFEKLGLRNAIFGGFTLALLLILGTVFLLVRYQISGYLQERLESRGRALAREGNARLGARGSDGDAGRLLTALVEGDEEVRGMVVLDEQGRVSAQSQGGPESPRLRAAIEAFVRSRHPARLELPDGDVVVSESLAPEVPQSGHILVVLDRSTLVEMLWALGRTVAFAFLVGFGVFLGLIWGISRRFILRPLAEMRLMASKLSEADLSGAVSFASDDELGSLAQALNRIGQALRETLGRVRGVSEGVAQVIEQLSRSGATVSTGASTILSRVEETSSSMAQMMASLRGIAENVEVLYQSAEQSSASITQMAATNEEVAKNVNQMAGSVEETTSAISEMTSSIKEVAQNIEALYASCEETSSSMSQMDVSIGQVETNANETARLSEQVSQDAATGVEALQKTLAGIHKIKDDSRTAARVIETLGKQIFSIGNVLDVIDDVAEQTNLLALNAAIIAAQAGEHGKGFAVVAEEIKELAERTGASTKEISDLIRGVQDESRNAVAAMNQGVRNVDEGVLLGREAEDALRKIFESANKTTVMVRAIARATVEQARGSKQVTESIQHIAETVQEISKASNEQARGSEQIMKSAEKMKLFTTHVLHSSQEQALGSKQITRSISNINEMVTHLNRAQGEQTQGAEQVLKAVETIKSVSEHQSRSVRQLEEAIELLQKQAEVLRAEVRRFRG